jgi:single-strand DNA-binding protein
MLNQAVIIGRLGKDPEVVNTKSGKTVAKFSVATEHGYGDKKQTSWVDIVCWEKTAEAVEKYVKKGSLVAAVGRIQTRSYDDRDGNKKYATEVVAFEVKFLESSNREDSGRSSGNRTQSSGDRQKSSGRQESSRFEADDDDIPF